MALLKSGSALTFATSPRTFSIQPLIVPDTPPGRCDAQKNQPPIAASRQIIATGRFPRRLRRRRGPLDASKGSRGANSRRDLPVGGAVVGATSRRTKYESDGCFTSGVSAPDV